MLADILNAYANSANVNHFDGLKRLVCCSGDLNKRMDVSKTPYRNRFSKFKIIAWQ
jgi:hypothetical protein